MKRNAKFFAAGVLSIVLPLGLILSVAEGNWLDKLRPNKSPQVLSTTAAQSPIQVHPDVISLQESFAKVADTVKPAVVNIATVQITKVDADPHQFYFGDPNEFFHRYFGEQSPQQRRAPPQREYRAEGTGSGVIIDPDGYILTNNHVVQGASQLTVTLSNDKSFRGKVIGTDARTDLAVIQIKSPNPLPFVPLGDSAITKVGDWVLAVGSPFGLEQTVTAGIISAIRQSLSIEGKSFTNLFQTDAAINRGNSGGPLVNLKGEVIGINTAIYAPTGVFSGIGFAIPVNQAKSVIKDLIEKGYVERSWMGVEIVPIDDVMAEQFNLDSTKGALINQVMNDSPAAKAGMERGDVIVEFDGTNVESVPQLQDVVSRTPPNKTVNVTVMRDGKSKKLKLTTSLMPNQPKQADRSGADETEESPTKLSRVEWLGATFVMSKSGAGVIASGVPADSSAAEAGLVEGDQIKSINRAPIKTLEDLKKATEKAKLKDGVVFDIVRNGRSFFLSFKSLQ